MRSCTIAVTDAAKEQFLHLPVGNSLQVFKNWILEKARTDHPELLDEIGDLTDGRLAIDFAPDDYGPLGLKVVIYRHNGLHIVIDSNEVFSTHQ